MYPPSTVRDRPRRHRLCDGGGVGGERITYAELDRRSNQLARFWQSRGVGPGGSVVLVMENNLAWPVAVAAGMRSGLYVTPVNWHLKPAELAALISEDRPAAIVTSVALAEQVVAAVGGTTDDHPVIVCADGAVEGCVEWDTALADQSTDHWKPSCLVRECYTAAGPPGARNGSPSHCSEYIPPRRRADTPGWSTSSGVGADSVLLSPGTQLSRGAVHVPTDHLGCRRHRGVHGEVRRRRGGDEGDRRPRRHPLTVGADHAGPPAASTGSGIHRALAPVTRWPSRPVPPCPPHVKAAIFDWWGGPILHEYYGASEGYGHTYISPLEAQSHPPGSVGRPLGAARVHITDTDGATSTPPANRAQSASRPPPVPVTPPVRHLSRWGTSGTSTTRVSSISSGVVAS